MIIEASKNIFEMFLFDAMTLFGVII